MKINKKLLNTIDFIEYITKTMKKEDILLLYKINNIKKEILSLLQDFVYSINDLVVKTYMGDDITPENERVKHFQWCWLEVVKSFKKEGIYFIEDQDFYDYLLTFYEELFYFEIKDDFESNKISVFWKDLLSYGEVKTMSEYESLLELYRIFSKSFVVN